jgi:hypothetical protein
MKTLEENVTVDEGVDIHGVRTKVHFEGGSVIAQKTYDAEPLLDLCHEERVATAGERWGEMRKVGYIPQAELDRLRIKTRGMSQVERMAEFTLWLKQNPRFVTFEKFTK